MPRGDKAVKTGLVVFLAIFLLALSYGVSWLAALFRGVVAGGVAAAFTFACQCGWRKMEEYRKTEEQEGLKKPARTGGPRVDVRAGADDDLARELAETGGEDFQPVNLANLYANLGEEKNAAKAAAAIRQMLSEKGQEGAGSRREKDVR